MCFLFFTCLDMRLLNLTNAIKYEVDCISHHSTISSIAMRGLCNDSLSDIEIQYPDLLRGLQRSSEFEGLATNSNCNNLTGCMIPLAHVNLCFVGYFAFLTLKDIKADFCV